MLKGEMHILKNADHIITVSESLKSFFPPEFQHKITVIENGSNFEQEEIITKINCKPSQFNVVYLGTVYDDQLFEEDFFIAFAEFYKNSTVKEQISLKFIGSDKNLKLKKILKKYGLDEISEITVRVDNETLIQYLLNASIFLHLRFKGRSKIISSKISDYLMFRKPILLPVSDKGDIADSITHYNAGYVCNGVGETLESLREEYKKYLTGESIVLHKNDFSWLSRKELAKKLTKIISSLNSPNPPSL
jgi:glycosyltransferase involved in cell wall biosynthesis